MKIVLSEQADNDVLDIVEYIAGDSIDRALSFSIELEEQIENLVDFPFKHPAYSELEYGKSVRVLHYHGYRIIYEVGGESIYIHEVTKDEKQPRDLRVL